MTDNQIEKLINILKHEYKAFVMLQPNAPTNETLHLIAKSFEFEYVNKDNLNIVLFCFLRGSVDVHYKLQKNFVRNEGNKENVLVYRPIFINFVKDKSVEVVTNESLDELSDNQVFIYDLELLDTRSFSILLDKLEQIFDPQFM